MTALLQILQFSPRHYSPGRLFIKRPTELTVFVTDAQVFGRQYEQTQTQ